ncbi:MAG: IscS subfamily cysteine desulfurase [Myxococcota bacterium]|nr:IscS subfamily cysteine desulfurase [Myxococcota bacterium]
MRLPIYMDHHATTPVDPQVLEVMLPFLKDDFGNASSRNHVFGWKAEEAVEASRIAVAECIGGTSREIVFTSGATESNNLALLGVAESYAASGKHIITQATEHKAILDTLAVLEKRGFEITVLPVDEEGMINPEEVRAAIRPDTILVSLMLVNNEVGTVQPLEAVGALCREAGVLLHCDAVQGVGKVPFDVEAMGVGLASLSAHKIYGPKGVGALYVSRRNPRVTLSPILFGGGHERGMRSGTLNVPGIAGLGEACRILTRGAGGENERIQGLRDALWARIRQGLDGVTLNGHPTKRHPGNLHVSFQGVEAEALIMALRDVAVSSGAACTSATLEPSHVMKALKVPLERAHSSVRFGLGRFNTVEEVDFVGDLVVGQVDRLRELAKSQR